MEEDPKGWLLMFSPCSVHQNRYPLGGLTLGCEQPWREPDGVTTSQSNPSWTDESCDPRRAEGWIGADPAGAAGQGGAGVDRAAAGGWGAGGSGRRTPRRGGRSGGRHLADPWEFEDA